jgi:hypothetical protein
MPHVRRDPFARLPTAARLWSAAALSALPLGLVWRVSAGFLSPGYILPGSCGYVDDGFCTTDIYVPGYYSPGSASSGAEVPARVFLVFAAVALAVCAARRRTPATRRLARLACVALAVGLAFALGTRATLVCVVLVLAIALVVPLVVPRVRASG